MDSQSSKKRARSDSDDSENASVTAKKIRDDLLDVLEDLEARTDSPDLDTFMKSFEIEISKLPESVADGDSVSDESRPDLGFLFEASDDELGLPPTDLSPVDSVEFGEVWGIDDQISSYDSFEYGFDYAGGGADTSGYHDDEYVMIDGLFDYTDLGLGAAELPLQPETMPAQ